MNARERFAAVMHYQPRDRSPIMDFGFWDETPIVWQEQGLPAGANTDLYFGMDPQWIGAPINCGLFPDFGYTVIEDRGNTRIVRDGNGVTKEEGKFLGSIPKHLSHTLVDRATWEAEFKPRLNGKDPSRQPADWNVFVNAASHPDRPYPLSIGCGSLYGWLRDWMGMENLSLLVYDAPDLFEEMVETLADCIIDTITPALEAGVQFDFASMWEDMCYRSGPLLSPKIFKRVLVPNYKRITGLLKNHGCDVVVLDCDGDIRKLLPLWLEGGVNCMFPIEVGTWGLDPVALRKEYGRDLLMVGGVGKRLLASGRSAIDAEIDRLTPLIDDGGYIPTPDHRVPPDVPLANYVYYLSRVRETWGKSLSNIPEFPAAEILNRTKEFGTGK
jgi:uroporphyrinogen decarboxylase